MEVMKKSKVLLVSAVLGVLYSVFLISYFVGINTNPQGGAEAIGAGIATALVLPHMGLVTLATIFNIVAWAMTSKAFAITTGVLYSVGAVVFLLYAVFVIPMIILSFVGVSRVGKIRETAKNNK